MYDATGQCIEQPYEETEDPDARFKDKIKMRAYPVEQKAGLLFAYLGPAPAPLVPNWDVYAATGVVRDIGYAELSCNWTPGPDLTEARYRHSATLLPDGRILLIGGIGQEREPDPPTDDKEIYVLTSVEVLVGAIPL